jgi:lipid II:glycine glycyltransferase (peptidoglycan interpeptide bridge formation enzyme)
LHRLDLEPDLDVLLRRFHKDSIQRKIRRAQRERLTYEEGRDDAILRKLCHLLEATRRRHQVPLQPMSWFRNLIECFGDRLSIHIASKNGQPVAGILTLAHRHTVVYKYGGSDARWNALGGMPLLFWNAIRDAKRDGAEEFDFGRSDCGNTGLIVFKDRWGTTRSDLAYWRSPAVGRRPRNGWGQGLARRLFGRFPKVIRLSAGRILYRHMG